MVPSVTEFSTSEIETQGPYPGNILSRDGECHISKIKKEYDTLKDNYDHITKKARELAESERILHALVEEKTQQVEEQQTCHMLKN